MKMKQILLILLCVVAVTSCSKRTDTQEAQLEAYIDGQKSVYEVMDSIRYKYRLHWENVKKDLVMTRGEYNLLTDGNEKLALKEKLEKLALLESSAGLSYAIEAQKYESIKKASIDKPYTLK